MVAAMMVYLIRFLLIHYLVFVGHFAIGLNLCRLNEAPFFKDFLPRVFIPEEFNSEFVFELKVLFCLLGDC